MNGYMLIARYPLDDVPLRLYDSNSELEARGEAKRLFANPEGISREYSEQTALMILRHEPTNNPITIIVTRITDWKPCGIVFHAEGDPEDELVQGLYS